MKTSNFEKRVKKLIKSNGDFSAIRAAINKKIENTSETKISRIRKVIPISFISVAAVFAQVVVVLLTISVINLATARSNNYQVSSGSTHNSSEPHSGETDNFKKFQWFTYLDKKYKCPDLNYGCVSKDLVGQTLDELEIVATHSLGSQTEKTKISIKSISNIDANYGIAVKFEGENEHYLYVVETLRSNISLKDFLDASGLSKYGVFVSASYTYLDGGNSKTAVSDKVDTTIKEILKRNEEVENIFSPDPSSPYCSFNTDISVKITIPLLGNTSTCFDINLDGRSRFSLINQNTYLINIDDAIALKDFILNNIS